jgi:hypothetical protein
MGSILFFFFLRTVNKTTANYSKLPEILMSNMAAPTDFLQIYRQLLLTILPNVEEILSSGYIQFVLSPTSEFALLIIQ